ncbi:MAG TPA: dTMP kinase [Candidatus Dormibacteraeota bacterium]|nr:dTMP kinase [Candidatus Dormibacteraeota bacterium]
MPLPQRGKLITFEGLDGVGKSTQMENLAATLRERGIDVVTTREPGGTSLGEKLRAVLLSSRTAGLSPLTELALMFADRAQHIDEQILPALHRGEWVLCDRFTDSSEAYQGGGRELGSELILQLHQSLCHDLQPDLTILMVSDAARAVARARRRNAEQSKQMEEDENRFEKEGRAFYERVLAAYLAIAKRAPERVVPVNATDPIPKVQTKIIRIVEERLFPAPPQTKFKA